MMKAFKLFWSDWKKAFDAGNEFYKKHWLGVIVYLVACGMVGFLSVFVPEKINERREAKAAIKEDETGFED